MQAFESKARTDGAHDGRFHTYPLLSQLKLLRASKEPLDDLTRAAQNWLLSELMLAAIKTRPDVPAAYKPRAGQYAQIEKEVRSDTDKSRCLGILLSMPLQKGARLGSIDFMRELVEYAELDYPSYYLQPFHSLPAGWLNPLAALNNQQAMEAIYRHAHPKKSIGIREAIARLVPRETKRALDLGAGTADMAALIAKRCPEARVTAVEASPAMLAVGKRMTRGIANLELQHGLAERSDVPEGTVDVVNISFVLHEVPDHIKRELLETAMRVLRPGGKLFITDVPPYDLDRHRGFFEPYRRQWQAFKPDEMLASVGFLPAEVHYVVDPEHMYTRVATKRPA